MKIEPCENFPLYSRRDIRPWDNDLQYYDVVMHLYTANRLVKHTGYGNAAGLLLAHGLLAGGEDSGQENYSSDSETSDTEEYQKSKK